jgi:RecA-family ATPase
LQFGLCISAGHPVFGGIVERATFIHVSCEDKVDTEVARRAQAIVARLGISRETAAEFLDRVGQDSALALMREGGGYALLPFWWDLRRKLLAIDGHKFVLLDSCYDVVRFEGKGKIDEAAVNAFVKTVLQPLCDETDSTLLVLWHPSQSGLDRGDAGGWSVAWHNSPRLRLSLSPVKDAEDAFELKVEKRSHGPKGKPLTLYWADGALLPRADITVSAHKVRLEQACAAVATEAAERGIPIQGKGKIARAHIDAIEGRIGARPSDRDVKEALTAAVLAGHLAHLKATRHRAAGYYPPDLEAAAELACAAKRQSTNGGE